MLGEEITSEEAFAKKNIEIRKLRRIQSTKKLCKSLKSEKYARSSASAQLNFPHLLALSSENFLGFVRAVSRPLLRGDFKRKKISNTRRWSLHGNFETSFPHNCRQKRHRGDWTGAASAAATNSKKYFHRWNSRNLLITDEEWNDYELKFQVRWSILGTKGSIRRKVKIRIISMINTQI